MLKTVWLKWLLALILTAVVAVIGVVIVELVLEREYATTLYEGARRHAPHPFLQVLPGSQVERVNPQGFRGDPIQLDKPPRAFRIFTIGGSTTLGVSNSYGDSYPAILQELLRQRHPDAIIEVQNAGSAWYTTAHDLIAYELRVRRYHPDLVIVFEAINDLTRSFSPPWWAAGAFQPDYSHYLGPYIRFRGPDVEFRDPSPWLLVNRLRQSFSGEPSPYKHRDPDNVARVAAAMRAVDDPDFKSLASFREYYQRLVRTMVADGTTVIMASQPFLYRADLNDEEKSRLYFAPLMCADHGTYPSLAAMIRGMQQFNAAAQAVAQAEGVPFIDFESAVPKTLEHFSDDVHMTRKANEILAGLAAAEIDQRRLIR
jgi:GDSL-like lipase/acylhydrolase family protein